MNPMLLEIFDHFNLFSDQADPPPPINRPVGEGGFEHAFQP